MDGSSIWMSQYLAGRQSYRDERTIEKIEEDIKKLEGAVSEQVEYEFLDRKAYCLNNSIIFHENDVRANEASLLALEEMEEEFKGSDWAVTKVLYTVRVQNGKRTLEEHKAELAKCKEEIKAYIFMHKRKKLDEELADAKDVLLDDINLSGSTPTPEP